MIKTSSRFTVDSRQQIFPWTAIVFFLGFLLLAWNIPGGVTAAVTADTGGLKSSFELGGSARSLGMGDAGVAVTGDGDSFFSNPAALATLSQNEILTFHAPLFADTLYDAVGYVNPIGTHNSFGIGFARIGTSNILATQTNIQSLYTFGSEQLQGLVGYGFQLLDGFDFGATVKYYREQVDNLQGSGVGLDVGALYQFSREKKDYSKLGYRNFTLGVAVSNALQPQIKLFQAADQPIMIIRPALSYFFEPSSDSSFWIAFEGEVPQTGDPLFKGGIEYGWNKTLFARAGFDGVSPTAGVGLRVLGFEVDYAFNQRDLGALHRFSLTYHFGYFRDPLQVQKIDLLKWVARSYTKTGDYDPAIQAWKNVLREYPDDPEAANSIRDLQKSRMNAVQDQMRAAKAAVERGDFDKALPLIAKIMSLDPGNPEAKELLKKVDKSLLVSTNYVRGVEAYSKEDYEMAVQYLQTVYDVNPQYRDVKFLYHDAQSHYMPLQSMPKELTDLYAKGVDYYMGGHYQKAIEAWQKVLEKDPKNYLVQRNLEEARSRLKDKPSPGSPEKQDSKETP